MEFASGQSLPNAVDRNTQSISLARVNVGSCVMPQGMTQQQDALFSYGSRQGVGLSDILCYWVEHVISDGSPLAGCASHPNSQPACVISALGSPWTLAHEVGHVLGLTHVVGNTMLMSTPTASIVMSPPSISDTDVVKIKRSKLCIPC
jgi:hypothetical protein